MEHCAPHTRAVHRATCLERKVVGRKIWYQTLELLPGRFHTLWSKTHNHRLLKACLLGSKRKLPCTSSLLGPSLTILCGLPFKGRAVTLATHTPVIRVLCQALEPTAFLVHPVLTAVAEECCCCPLQCDS